MLLCEIKTTIMKLKHTLMFGMAALASLFLVAFAPKNDNYTIDLAKSSVQWEGKKFTGGHNGTVNLNSGNLSFNGKKLIGGGFVADMTTIKDADKSANLEKHLKSDDFFGVEKHATAKFNITKVEGTGNNLKISGNLTIKGVTKPVTFPATLTWNEDKTVTAVADKIEIDRTQYGIEYRSKSIFSNIGDNFIYDNFTISVKLVAKK